MKNIYLIRHGESLSNAGGEAMRNPDIPLTDLGFQQAEWVTDWLMDNVENVTSVSVSTFIRTHQTAEPLLRKLNRQAVILEGLQEFNYINFDHIDGLPAIERRELSAKYWQKATPDFIDGGACGDAESFNQLNERMTTVIDYFSGLPVGNHVIYTHGLWLSLLIWRLLSMPIDDNAAMQQFRQFEQALKIKNTEVFQLQLCDDKLPALTKIRDLSE